MQLIHGFIGLTTLADGAFYAECSCGVRTYGDDETEAFAGYTEHRRAVGRE